MRTQRKVLRRGAALVAALAAAFFMGSLPAHADNGPHVSTAGAQGAIQNLADAGQGRCASCHRAHTAQSGHLVATTQQSLCYTCHGGAATGATTDVQNGLGYDAASSTKYTVVRGQTVVGGLRGGGFDQAAIDTAAAEKHAGLPNSKGSTDQKIPVLTDAVSTTSNHLGGQGIMWGNGPISLTPNAGKALTSSTQLACGSCHNPHGNGNYRILRPVPSNSGISGTGVTIADTSVKVYTTTNYWIAGDPNVPASEKTTTVLRATSATDPTPVASTVSTPVSPYLANVSAWCTTCHTRYLAHSGANTNSGDAVFAYRHTSDSVNADINSDGTVASNRTCTQCHVAHGSNAKMPNSNVTWPNGTTPSMDSRLLRADDRGVCVACHNV